MALRPHLQDTSSTSPLALNTYVAPKPAAGLGELFKAGWEADSDIKAYWDIVSRPSFEPDPTFDPLNQTKGSKYWDSPFRNNFAEAASKDQWNSIAENIEREQRNSEILESAGWAGVGVRLLYGMVSPTMLLPAVSTFRGGRGVAAAAGLGAAAGALQEIPLQLAQETRDFSEVIASVGGGAFLGGVMGAGYNVWRGMARLPEVKRVELDMAAGETPSTIHPSAKLAENPVLLRADGDGVRIREGTVLREGGGGLDQPFMVFRGPEVLAELPPNTIIRDLPGLSKVKDGSVVLDSPEAQALRRAAAEDGVDAVRYKNEEGEEIVEVISPRALAALDDAEELTVLQEGTFVRAPSSVPEGSSVGAARTPVEPAPEGLAPTFGGNTKAVEVLSKVSPPARVIAQKTFKVARAMMLKLSQGGVTLEGASAGKVARAGGTVETRARLYDAFLNRTVEIIDNAYVDYLYGSARPGFAANMRASTRSLFGQTGEKLSKVDFQKAIGRSMFDGDRSDIAEVQTAAQALRKEVYDPIMREATGPDVKLFKMPKEKGEDAELDETADLSYLTRLYDTQAINRNLRGFHDFLTNHFEQKILARYEKAIGRAKNLDELDDQMIELLGLDPATATKLQEDTLKALTDMGETDAEVLLKTTQKEVTRLRKEIREGAPNKDVLRTRMEEAKAEVKALKEGLRERLDERASYKKRLAVLDRTWWAEEQSRASVLKDINRLEELSLASLNAVFTRGMAMQRKLDSFDPVQMAKQLETFRNQIVNATERINRAYAKLAKEGYRRAEGWSAPFAADINRFGDLKTRLEDKIARFDEADDILGNVDVVKAWLESVQRDMLEATNALNLGRGERIAGLKARADFDPREKAEALVTELQANKAQRATDLNEQVRGLGITDFDPNTAKVVARERAESVSGRIRGMNNRIAGLELLGEERGAALARQLDFRSIDAVEWLETDILRATQTYVRQMAGDIELKRAFGDVNAKEQFAEFEREYNAVNERRAKGPASAEELAALKAKHAEQLRRIGGGPAQPAPAAPTAPGESTVLQAGRAASPEERITAANDVDPFTPREGDIVDLFEPGEFPGGSAPRKGKRVNEIDVGTPISGADFKKAVMNELYSPTPVARLEELFGSEELVDEFIMQLSKVSDDIKPAWQFTDEIRLPWQIYDNVQERLGVIKRVREDMPTFETGKPLVADAFHGTTNVYDEFSADKLGTATGANSAKKGFFLSRGPQTANTYADPFYAVNSAPPISPTALADVGGIKAVAERVLKELEKEYAEDPISVSFMERNKLAALRSFLDDAETQKIIDDAFASGETDVHIVLNDWAGRNARENSEAFSVAYLIEGKAKNEIGADPKQRIPSNVRMERIRMENPLVRDFKGGDYTEYSYSKLIDEAKAVGHDGVVMMNTRDGGPVDDVFVVFSPDQIKKRKNPPAEAEVGGTVSRQTMQVPTAANDDLAGGPLNQQQAPVVQASPEVIAELKARHAAEIAEVSRPAATKKELDALKAEYNNVNYALRGTIARVRRTWGIPDDPDGFSARAGKVLLDLSVLRYMGGVLVSSFPDMARVLTVHGVGRTIMDGLVPLLLNFEGAKASMRELRLAGGALDHVLTSRAAAYLDILESSANSTRFERGVNTMAANIGRVAGFDYWTSALKQFSSVIENTRMADSIELVTRGGDPKDVAEATEYLAKLNINSEYAQRIAVQFDNGGSTRVGNMRYPNTEDWTDPGAVTAYRAALRQASDNIIITPGLERPLIMDKGLGWRLLFQFKSFTMSSHTKTLVTNLQQKDMAVVQGAILSLALGALSYYTYATIAGGKIEAEMRKAGPGKWMDEAMNRSGLMGVFGEFQRITTKMPLLKDYTSFSREEINNRGAGNWAATLLGPNFATLQIMDRLQGGLEEPTKGTVKSARQLMLPYQNVFWLRRILDEAEKALAADLPEKRNN